MSHKKNIRAKAGCNLYECPTCKGPLSVTVSMELLTEIKVDGAQTRQFTCNAGHQISVALTTMPAMGRSTGRVPAWKVTRVLWKNGGKL